MTELYGEAARAAARGSKSFFFAARFFPPELARAAHAVYWFCRTTDDLVDEAPTPEQARRDIDAWEAALRRALEGEEPESPVLRLFCAAVRDYRIPHEYPLELIAGVRMDLVPARFETFAGLRLYCYRVASVVGLMMMHVIGFRPGAEPYAADLGIAMQLTNILRDLGEDLRRGRLYVPREDLLEFGVEEPVLRAGHRDAACVALLKSQILRARAFYRRAEPGIAMLDSRGRFAVEIAARVYAAILDRIEESGYDVFDRRAVVPRTRKYWIAARSLAWPALRQSARRLVQGEV